MVKKITKKLYLLPYLLLINSLFGQSDEMSLTDYSSKFIYSVLKNNIADIHEQKQYFKNLNFHKLKEELNDDKKKKTFWINIYNGFIIDQLRNDASLYENKGNFFSSKHIEIAGEKFSFDLIEHGLLRRSKAKFSLGLFGKILPSKLEKNLRVNTLDYRIHFALNCGANSCPPVRIYHLDKIDNQLTNAEKYFIKKISEYNINDNKVTTSMIFNWFRADFGKLKGIKNLLRQNLHIKNEPFSLAFRKYDWTLNIDNFVLDDE